MDKIHKWPSIKYDDIKALLTLSLFLKGCSNLTEHIIQMKELNLIKYAKHHPEAAIQTERELGKCSL